MPATRCFRAVSFICTPARVGLASCGCQLIYRRVERLTWGSLTCSWGVNRGDGDAEAARPDCTRAGDHMSCVGTLAFWEESCSRKSMPAAMGFSACAGISVWRAGSSGFCWGLATSDSDATRACVEASLTPLVLQGCSGTMRTAYNHRRKGETKIHQNLNTMLRPTIQYTHLSIFARWIVSLVRRVISRRYQCSIQ